MRETRKTAKVTRVCAGEYEVGNGVRTVRVTKVRYPDGTYWIAAANWDRWLMTDPLYTKREAVFNARDMLNG